MTTQLKAFHSDPKVKKFYMKRVLDHRKADEIIHGTYWENGKGCCVGCIIHSNKHSRFETELGLPAWLAHLTDYLFENLPNGKAKMFPEQVLKSIKVGVNLDPVYHKFCIFLLKEVCQNTDHRTVKNAIDQVVEYHTKILTFSKDDPAESARSAAESAARSAAWSAAQSAWSAAQSAWSAESAARSAAWSAAQSAWSVESAARSAAWSAAWSAAESAWSAAESAWSAAESAAVQKIADKLIVLLGEAK